MGEVPEVFLETITGGDQEEVTLSLVKRGFEVGSKEEIEWVWETRVGGRGNSNMELTTKS